MDDLISRQAAIETIFNEPLYESGMKEKTAIEVVLAIYEKIKSLPSSNPERKTGEWIPCSERLPEKEGNYQVMLDKRNLLENETQVTDAYWIDDQWKYGVLESYEHRMPKFVIEPIQELKVIAWMPFPEPYKGEES